MLEFRRILEELDAVLSQIPARAQQQFIDDIFSANRIFLAGVGRSEYIARCFAMRLMHLGLEAHAVGDTTTPPIGPKDLLLFVSGSGETSFLVTIAAKAKVIGTRISLVTAATNSTLMDISNYALVLAAPNKFIRGGDASNQPMASLFEQSSLLFFDGIVLQIMDKYQITEDEMAARHANLE